MVSVACFRGRVWVMFYLMFVHYTLSSVWVVEWPPFGKYVPARLVICAHCLLSFCNFYLFPILVLREGFGFCLLQFLFIAFLLKPRYGPSSAFPMNIFIPLKGSKLIIFYCYHCSWCCAVWRPWNFPQHSSLVQIIFYFWSFEIKDVF